MKTETQTDKELGIPESMREDFNAEKDANYLHVKLIIAGGRDFSDYDLVVSEADLLTKGRETLIISGGAKGGDELGERYAKARSFLLNIIRAEWNKYGRAAGPKRNEAMAQQATHLLAFWDGKSPGTHSMIKLAKKYNLVTRVVRY